MRRATPLLILGTLALLGCSTEAEAPDEGNDGKVEKGPPPHRVGGFRAEAPPARLAPGEETYPCWIVPLEIEGPSHFVNAAVMRTTRGLHHGNITTRPRTGDGLRPCGDSSPFGEASDVLAGGAVLFGSTTQLEGEEWRRFPPDMAYRVKDGFEIVMRLHYLNTTEAELEVETSYEWFTIPEEAVEREVGPMFWQIKDFVIPARSEYTTQTECWLPEAMQVVEAMPHMHALGTAFKAWFVGGPRDGELFIDQPGYEPDGAIRKFEPPVDLGQGDGFSFSCTWRNGTSRDVPDGPAGNDEMCMLFGYAYPATRAYTVTAKDNSVCAAIRAPDPTER